MYLSNQEAFNIMVKGLRKQGRKSIDNHSHNKNIILCKLRNINNDKCSIGWIIPDEKYDPKMELDALGDIDNILCRCEFTYDDSLEDLLNEMRTIHDCCEVDEWEKGWKDIAAEFNLTIPPINEPTLPINRIEKDIKTACNSKMNIWNNFKKSVDKKILSIEEFSKPSIKPRTVKTNCPLLGKVSEGEFRKIQGKKYKL